MPEMLTTIPSLAASFLLSILAVAGVIKNRTTANMAFCAAALLLSSIEITDQALMSNSFDLFAVNKSVLLLESLLPASLLFFSLTYYRLNPLKSMSPWWCVIMVFSASFPISLFIFPLGDFFYAPDFLTEKMLFLGTAGYWFYLSIMVYCIMAIMNLETVFSMISGVDRWKIRFEFIGMCSILAVLIFYYSHSLLYRTINMNLIPIRSWVFLIGSLLVGYSRLMRGNDARVAVSRYVLYRSFALMVIGGYLLFLGLIGEGMKYFGSSFGHNVMIFSAFAVGIFIMGLFSSETLRRKIKVLINKHFYANKYDYRNEWLKFIKRLSSCRSLSDVEQTILTTYRETFGLKGISLYLGGKEEGSFYLAARQGMNDTVKTIRLSPALFSYFAGLNRVLNPLDREFIPFREEASFALHAGVRLVVPLMSNNTVEGLVLFGEQLSTEEFIYEDYDLMKMIAGQATLSIINFKLSEELAETRELAAVAKISSFVIHDLKNNAYTLSLLLENANNYIGDEDFQKNMVVTIRNTVARMQGLIQRLKTVPEKNMLNRRPADLDLLVQEALQDFRTTVGTPKLSYAGTSALSTIDKGEIKKVIVNLLLNALDATGGGSGIKVETGTRNGSCYIRVEDRGCGMTAEFINSHLFKPFRTTKETGLGIGLYQSRQIVEAHDGKIEVQSEIGRKTIFTVYLPSAETAGKVLV